MKVRAGPLPGMARLLQTLGVNSVPAAGFFGQGWSLGTTLGLYWLETVLVIVLVSLRIVWHRRLTRKAGHWNIPYEVRTTVGGKTTVRTGNTTVLASFLGVMVPFTAAHGFFLGLLIFLAFPEFSGLSADVRLDDLARGTLAIAVFLGIGLTVDLVGLGERPFRWIERVVERAQGRMIVTHLTIIFGLMAMGVWEAPWAFFAVFFGFKTLVDLGGLMPEPAPRLEPPRWLAWMDGLGSSRTGQTFSQHFRRSAEADLRKREANERVVEDRVFEALTRERSRDA